MTLGKFTQKLSGTITVSWPDLVPWQGRDKSYCTFIWRNSYLTWPCPISVRSGNGIDLEIFDWLINRDCHITKLGKGSFLQVREGLEGNLACFSNSDWQIIFLMKLMKSLIKTWTNCRDQKRLTPRPKRYICMTRLSLYVVPRQTCKDVFSQFRFDPDTEPVRKVKDKLLK